jgi:DnaK suppressor protein
MLSTPDASRALGRREGLAIERTPDALDEVQFASARELSTRNLERESGLLRQVRAALDRIADGTYGACLHCDEEISQKRLKAVPWATLCIACQEQSDRNRRAAVRRGNAVSLLCRLAPRKKGQGAAARRATKAAEAVQLHQQISEPVKFKIFGLDFGVNGYWASAVWMMVFTAALVNLGCARLSCARRLDQLLRESKVTVWELRPLRK